MMTENQTTELEAARRVVKIAKRYRDWMFGAQITPADKSELIDAVDAYEEIANGR